MEIPRGNNHILVREDVRVVRSTVYLGLDHALHIADAVFHRAVHLRDAAEGIRVLDVLLRPADKLAPFQQTTEHLPRFELPPMRTEPVRELVERLDAAVESLQRDGSDAVGPERQTLAVQKRPDRVRTHKLRAVQKRETFLRLKPYRLPAVLPEHFGARTHASFGQYLPQPDERQGQVGEGGEVARGAQ